MGNTSKTAQSRMHFLSTSSLLSLGFLLTFSHFAPQLMTAGIDQMSSSNISNESIIIALDKTSTLLNRYVPILIYIFGIIGNLLNVLVLAQPTLRINPSAACFLVSSLASFIVIVSGLTSRMMSGYAVDLTLTVDWICQMRNVVLYAGRTVALWMIALAAVDRWLSSNADERRRRSSSLRNARHGMLVIVVYACVINAPIVFCYRANLAGAIRGCYGATYVCRVVTDMIYVVGTTLLPLILMTNFGVRTINNVRSVRRRIETLTVTRINRDDASTTGNSLKKQDQRQMRKRDRHLLRMLVVQIVVLFVMMCPHAIQKAYTSIASPPAPNSVENAVNNFIFNFLTLLTFTASGMPFYIYTLSGGSVFRNALLHLLKRVIANLLCC